MVITSDNPLAIRGIKRKVPRIAIPLAKMVDYWGAPCDEYQQGCPSCEAWSLFNKSGKFATDKEVNFEITKGAT
jgi:hypothetical protein